MTQLSFAVLDAAPKKYTATPTIAFRLHVASAQPIEALVLRAQLRIEPQWREYTAEEKPLLNDLFGTPERWGTTLRALAWADLPLTVTGFEGETTVELPVPCTYDFDLAATRFLNALGTGEVPLRFLFSGAVFAAAPSGFMTERVPWSSECAYRMPVQVWRDAMRSCYGDDALIRINAETLARLQRYRALSGAASWDELFGRLTEAPV